MNTVLVTDTVGMWSFRTRDWHMKLCTSGIHKSSDFLFIYTLKWCCYHFSGRRMKCHRFPRILYFCKAYFATFPLLYLNWTVLFKNKYFRTLKTATIMFSFLIINVTMKRVWLWAFPFLFERTLAWSKVVERSRVLISSSHWWIVSDINPLRKTSCITLSQYWLPFNCTPLKCLSLTLIIFISV